MKVTHEQAREALGNLRMNLGGETIGTERLARYIDQQEAEPQGAPEHSLSSDPSGAKLESPNQYRAFLRAAKGAPQKPEGET